MISVAPAMPYLVKSSFILENLFSYFFQICSPRLWFLQYTRCGNKAGRCGIVFKSTIFNRIHYITNNCQCQQLSRKKRVKLRFAFNLLILFSLFLIINPECGRTFHLKYNTTVNCRGMQLFVAVRQNQNAIFLLGRQGAKFFYNMYLFVAQV